MGSGCGSCVFYGLLHGYKIYGIDPPLWKYKFNEMKAKKYSYPSERINWFIIGLGENIPFEEIFFNYISTIYTLEHIQTFGLVLKEMIHNIKSECGIHIKYLDYIGNFKGH